MFSLKGSQNFIKNVQIKPVMDHEEFVKDTADQET